MDEESAQGEAYHPKNWTGTAAHKAPAERQSELSCPD